MIEWLKLIGVALVAALAIAALVVTLMVLYSFLLVAWGVTKLNEIGG
jgi:hypothetical protein